jgi:hypothetical protein
LGFFDPEKRFNFDANGSVGHNTLLVDGQGQRLGAAYGGRISTFRPGLEVDMVTGEGEAAYGDKLRRFSRTLAFVKPDLLLVYDLIVADGPRLLEWLFHHRALANGDERQTTFAGEQVSFSLRRVLPELAECWRVSDVERTSAYTNSNTGEWERMRIQYRSFGPFYPVERAEVLWAIWVGQEDACPEILPDVGASRITVRVVDRDREHEIHLIR